MNTAASATSCCGLITCAMPPSNSQMQSYAYSPSSSTSKPFALFRSRNKQARLTSSCRHSSVSPSASLLRKGEAINVMISGPPASGKGTQSELISKKYGLIHIAAGDLLRAEIDAQTLNGKRAKECMEKGELVPNEIVVTIVKDRMLKPDSQEHGWLLDGYPRSFSQASALQSFGFRPDIFILLEVSEDILVERVVGRRLDPVTGRIYHLKYSPPETQEIAARLTQRFDDTVERVNLRLQTHHQNVEAVLSMYEDITYKVDGNASKDDVFSKIDCALKAVLEAKRTTSSPIIA